MHSDNNYHRLAGRVILKNLDSHIIVGLILIGSTIASFIANAILAFFYPWSSLGLVLNLILLRSLFLHIKKSSNLKRKLESNMYATSDKSYVWAVEETRDKLMVRILQENICPWSSDNQCIDKANCICANQKKLLIMSDVYRDQKVVLKREHSEN